MRSLRVGAGLIAIAALLLACGDDTPSEDAGTGCPELEEPLAQPGDAIDGDNYATLAQPFFDAYCVRCHASTRVTGTERNNAPPGDDWDLESSVRAHLMEIRYAVGVNNYMPLNAPFPTCDERARLVRWIDADAP